MGKKYFLFLFIISVVILFTVLCMAGIVQADEHDDIKIEHNSNLKITNVPVNSSGGVECRMVYSASSVTNDYFIPTKTKAEWDAFVAHKPAGITIGACQCIASTISGYSYPNITYGASAPGTRSITNGSCTATISCSSTGVVTVGSETCTCTSGYYNSATGSCVSCLYDSHCSSGYYCNTTSSSFYSCNYSANANTCQKKCWNFTESTALVTFWENDTVSATTCSATYRDNPKCLDGHPNATPTCPSACNDVRDNLGTPNSKESCCKYYNAFGCGDWDARVKYRCSERQTYTRYFNDSCRRSLTSTAINGRVNAFGVCTGYCGDGVCTSTTGEDCNTCQSDCGYCTVGYCGDGICNWGEDYDYCTQDCGYSYQNNNFCGDGYCDISNDSYENSSYCPDDCGYLNFCGNSYCEPSENEDNYTCPDDCY